MMLFNILRWKIAGERDDILYICLYAYISANEPFGLSVALISGV